jgi:ABC-type dipeptide/oligopeptide/nickel transport system ATPase component
LTQQLNLVFTVGEQIIEALQLHIASSMPASHHSRK